MSGRRWRAVALDEIDGVIGVGPVGAAAIDGEQVSIRVVRARDVGRCRIVRADRRPARS